MCYQPPGTDIYITFKSSLMRGHVSYEGTLHASPSSSTSGGAGARLQKLPARCASPSSSGSSDGAKAIGGFPSEGHSNARHVFIDLTCTTKEQQEGRKNKGKGNPTTATSNK